MDTASLPRTRPRTSTLRLAAVFVLMGMSGVAGWLALRSPAYTAEPAGVWDYIRDRVLDGDGEAPWRMLLPAARPKFLEFVRQNAEAPEDDARATAWRKKVGLSRQDLRTLPPEKVMAREYLADRDRIRGSRVFRTDRWAEDQSVIYISLKDGGDIHFVVRRVAGAWKIEDLIPVVTSEHTYIPYPGAPPVKIPR